MVLIVNVESRMPGPRDARCSKSSKIVDAHVVASCIVYEQHDTAVAFMGIASVNIYAGTIIVYIIAGMANTDKRGSLEPDARSFSCSWVLSCLETGRRQQGRSENDSTINIHRYVYFTSIYIDTLTL